MADEIKATPVKNKGALGLSKAVQKAHELLSKPFGYNNPPGEILSELVGLPAVAKTFERIGYGEPLTTGAGGIGGTSRPREEVMETGMVLAPLSRPTAKAAKNVGKFAGTEGARLIERGMFGEGPLAPITPKVMALDVWHGSPHKFAPTPKNPLGEFDPTKIGTGEGAQAFGHGHYTAEAPGVAVDYKRKLSSSVEVPEGTPSLEKRIAEMAVNFGGDDPIAWLRKYEKGAGHTVPALTPELVETAIKKFESGEFKPGGYLYKIDLSDEAIPKMLDWDKPLSEQPEVIKALKGSDYEVGISQKEAEKIADARLREEAYEWADETGGDPVDYINNANWEKYVNDARKESGAIDSALTGKQLHELLLKDQGYRPDLFDPYNYQVDTSEALRGMGIPGIKYLDRSSRDAGEGTRNFVVFPGNEDLLNILERKKEGGSVSISDNPDAMMMEVEDQGFAIGGRVIKRVLGIKDPAERAEKATELLTRMATSGEDIKPEVHRALLKAQSGERSLPTVLPRANPKTKEEIQQIAQRTAEQLNAAKEGRFLRVDPSKSINAAGKSKAQWEMEQNLGHDIRPLGTILEPIKTANIEDQLGMLKMGISGDTSISDQVLHRAGDYLLKSPSEQQGGPLFGLRVRPKPAAWASNNPVLSNLQSDVNEFSRAYGDVPVIGQYKAMGPQGTNFAQHFADANLEAINTIRMTPEQIEMTNQLIREGNAKSGKFPDFPGIEDPGGAYFFFSFYPELRKHFNEIMVKPDFTKKLGLPDGRVILHAITDPELRDMPVLTSGKAQYQLVPNQDPKKLPLSEHSTYTNNLPRMPDAPVTQTPFPVPSEIEFSDVFEYAKPRYKPSEMTRVMQTASPRQIVDRQHIDEIKTFEEFMRRYAPDSEKKKEGGKVEKAKEFVSDAANRGLDAVFPMRRAARLGVLVAMKNSPMVQASRDPDQRLMMAENAKNVDADIEEFKRLTKNRLKGLIGMKQDPIPEYDMDEFFRRMGGMEPIDEGNPKPAIKPIDGFKSGGLIKVQKKRKAKA